jgi:hypothetical protein
MTAPTDFGIGTTATTTHLEDLTVLVPNPKSPLQFYAEYATMASGKAVGRGLPIISWEWGYLELAQRDQLRVFCASPVMSAIVYIDSQSNDNADQFEKYKCVMKWPEREDRDATRRVPFRLEFILCEKQ